MDIDEYFAGQVRTERLSSAMTQEQVVAKMNELGHSNFHQATMFKIESSRRKVTIGEAYSLARVLGVSLDDLLPAQEENALRQSALTNADQLALQLMDNQRLIRRAIDLYGKAPE